MKESKNTLQKCLDPYILTMSVIGFMFAIKYLLFSHFTLGMVQIVFIGVLFACEYYEFDYHGQSVAVSMNIANALFLLYYFGPSVAILGISVCTVFISALRVKRGQLPSLLSKKVAFNVSMFIICVVITNGLMNIMGKELVGYYGLLKLFIWCAVYNLCNSVLLTLVVSFASGAWFKDEFSVKSLMYYYYSYLLSTTLILLYLHVGVAGAIFTYLMFLPFQRYNTLYTRSKDQEQELFVDTLTQAYNYKYLEHIVNNKITKEEQFAILFIDMDKFKLINDTYGHSAGNEALKVFSKTLKNCLRKDDYLFRYGGDEFCVIIKDIFGAKVVADKILNNSYMVDYEGNRFEVKFSVGLYNNAGNEKNLSEIIAVVDTALYKAKAEGGHKIIYCNE